MKAANETQIAEAAKPDSSTEKQDVGEDKSEGQGTDPLPVPDQSESKDASEEETSIETVMAVQLKIEQEMQKRRQRLEAWRQKMLTDEATHDELKKSEDSENIPGWSLEDDEEEDQLDDKIDMDVEEGDEETPVSNEASEVKMEESDVVEATKMESEEEVDPLDAFMVGVQEEVNHIKNQAHKNAGDKFSTSGEISVYRITSTLGQPRL